MTDYERLAADLTAAGIRSTVADAYKLAGRAWAGAMLPDREARIVAAWEDRTAAASWNPEIARQRTGQGLV